MRTCLVANGVYLYPYDNGFNYLVASLLTFMAKIVIKMEVTFHAGITGLEQSGSKKLERKSRLSERLGYLRR